MFKKILWATDFSEHARYAGRRALQCAQCSDGILYALTVVDPEDLPLILDNVPDPFIEQDEVEQLEQRLEQQYEQQVLDHLQHEIEQLDETQTPISPLLRVGTPWREIVSAADELSASLIVIGSHGKRSLEELLLGSTVERVTRHANCPVIIVSHRPPHPGAATPKRYLLATDFSPHAQLAEKVAISLAKERGEGRRLWVLTVIEPGEEIPMPPGFVVDAPDQAVTELETELRAEVEKAVGRRLDGIVADARAQGVEAEKLIRHGHPDKEILKAAIDIEADMIIMGSHSRQSLRDKLMGDTPAAVTRGAPCPVLVVSHPPQHRGQGPA